jgi:hypothetical protein
LDSELLEIRKSAALDYKDKHLGHFVTIIKKDGYKVKGILKSITPDFLLFIENNYGSFWRVDPLEIADFYGRPDRLNGGGQNH